MMQVNRINVLPALIVAVLVTVESASMLKRTKRALYELPDGIEDYVGTIRTTFQCPGDGYYADIDNDCKLFHVCITHTTPKGKPQQQVFSFACGNTTVFNQFSFTCSHEDESIPCQSSPDFYYLNELLYAGPDAIFHTSEDVDRAASYGNRLPAASRRSGRLINGQTKSATENAAIVVEPVDREAESK